MGNTIDLNCDMGESFGRYQLGVDAEIIQYITSANIACGMHAGDPREMETTVTLAVKAGVNVGAHPGYPDLHGFGRRSMEFTQPEIEALVLYQVAALAGFARDAGVELVHVKPHGALYNQAAKDRALAGAIARGVARFSRELVLVGLAGSQLVAAGHEAGLHTASEGFADRAYNPDGSLRARNLPGALIEQASEAAAQAVSLAQLGIPITTGSHTYFAPVDTLCIHGDTPGALDFARAVHAALEDAEIKVQKFGRSALAAS
jgi:5-oxoprolinase (ATP-hydrolysing) subunit A